MSLRPFAAGLLTLGLGLSWSPAALAQTLRALTTDNYPPFEFRIEETAERPGVYGFDIELAETIARNLGLQIQFKIGGFEQLLPRLITGQGDLAIAAISITPERAQQVDFSEPYFEAQDSLVSLRSLPTDQSLSGLKLGYIQGTVQAQQATQLKTRYSTLQLKSYADVTTLLKALTAREINVALVESVVANIFAQDDAQLIVQKLKGASLERYAIAFPKGSPYREQFNREIRRLRNSGELTLMIRRWFSAQQ
ncbi:transporter substrate-binding domain-containing protein [Synechococcus elongatus IITB4]|uniref:transporter substrate-binding domain-containing protein n=1 Tax=Synechococcus elongatus TaxID=32046 RepID=UPI0030D120D8